MRWRDLAKDFSTTRQRQERLDAWVGAQADALRACAPGAVAATKELLRTLPVHEWAGALASAAQTSAALFAGPEAAEGMEAFLQKRPPSWDAAP